MEKRNAPRLVRRIGSYLLGLFIMTLGIAVSIQSDLGVSPVSSVPLVLSNVTGVEVGTMTAVVFCCYVLFQVPLLGRSFSLVQLLEVPCAVLFGKFVTLSSRLIAGWVPASYPERLIMCALSIALIALGLKLYLLADLIPQAGDGLVLEISRRFGWKMANVKNVFDLTCITFAALLSLVCTGRLQGLREGTVLAALGVGRVVALIEKHFGAKMARFVRGAENKD